VGTEEGYSTKSYSVKLLSPYTIATQKSLPNFETNKPEELMNPNNAHKK